MASPPSPPPAPTRLRPPEDRATETRRTERLFRRWRDGGDPRAREEIFLRHLPLARRLASRYWTAFEPFDDLFQVTCLGLVAAMERFDPARGVAFPAFAIPTMLGELKRHFRDTGWSAHVPRRVQELARRVEMASRELSTVARHAPSVAALAEYLELSTEDVVSGLQAAAAHHSVSLQAPAHGEDIEDGGGSLVDTIGTEDERLALVETAVSVAAEMRRIPPPERRALTLRLERDLKQSEIAECLGCSQMQVSRLLRSAAARLEGSGVG